jgi:predicted PurR-regulated permease PerM
MLRWIKGIATTGQRRDLPKEEPARQDASPAEGGDIDIFPAIDPDGPLNDDPDGDLSPVQPILGRLDTTPESEKLVTRIEVPFRTIVHIALSLFGIWVIVQIYEILLLVFVAFLLALALVPPVRYLQNRGLPRAAAAGVTFLMLIALIAGFFGIIVPPLVEQGQSVIDNFPQYTENLERIVARYPALNERYVDIRENGLGEDVQLPWSSLVSVGVGIFGRIANFFFVLVLTFYLLLEGERSYRFAARYCTPRLRFRMRRAFPELTRVISGFVIGQVITSLMFGVFAYVTLVIAGVPEPLLLAVLAAALDAVPIIGVPVATVPAILLAATVSWQTAVVVLIAYVVYQQFENYVLVPRVYGTTLQVTSLSILVGVLIGGQLLGILGVILALPLTAAIPVLERVWREEVPEHLTLDMI